jgi:putative nucleotidyltransferase with HDIG domain
MAAGVLLLDSLTDKLYVRVEYDLPELDGDTQQVLSCLAPDLEQAAEQMGGSCALAQFQDDWSNTLQLSGRETIEIRDPIAAIQQIFESRVVASGSLKLPAMAGKSTRSFTQEDLLAARQLIPFSPAVTMKLLMALQDPGSNLAKIEALITREPTIATHLIRLANSALYSPGVEIRSISRAVVRLGIDCVKLHVLALTIRRAFFSPHLHRIWNHSIDAVQIARHLCRQLPSFRQDEVALLTLVHDIGQLTLFALGQHYSNLYAELRRGGQYPLQIERALCGSSHAEIGADLLNDWGFPADMVDAVRNHHEPSRSDNILASFMYLVESFSETDEAGVIDLAEHARALTLTRVDFRRTELVTPDRRLDSDLVILRLATSASA